MKQVMVDSEDRLRLLLFVPEGNRTDKDIPIELQDRWVTKALRLCVELFGGATAYARGVGAWQKPIGKKRHIILWDRITIIESWVDLRLPRVNRRMERVGKFASQLRRALKQDAILVIINNVFKTITR